MSDEIDDEVEEEELEESSHPPIGPFYLNMASQYVDEARRVYALTACYRPDGYFVEDWRERVKEIDDWLKLGTLPSKPAPKLSRIK